MRRAAFGFYSILFTLSLLSLQTCWYQEQESEIAFLFIHKSLLTFLLFGFLGLQTELKASREMLPLHDFLTTCALSFFSIAFLQLCYLEFFAFEYPKDLPRVGFPSGIFSRTRASIRQIFRSPADVENGYRKVRPSLWVYISWLRLYAHDIRSMDSMVVLISYPIPVFDLRLCYHDSISNGLLHSLKQC